MRILIAGGQGLIGTALIAHLRKSGCEVRVLFRDKSQVADEAHFFWSPDQNQVPEKAFEGCDAVINLSGENIASRWTQKKKRAIETSRISATRTLVDGLIKQANPGAFTFINASAIGFYGNRGDEWLDEASQKGVGFLSDVCQRWEEEAAKASSSGARVVILRLGVVFSAKGGALAKMITPFKWGLGGPVGSGSQYVSWVAIDDTVRAIEFCLREERLEGVLNVTAPEPVTSRALAKALGRALARPAFMPLPAFVIRLLMGQMGEELLLTSARVRPKRLQEAGFAFLHPCVESAIAAVVDRSM